MGVYTVVEMRIIRIMFDNLKQGIALYKYEILLFMFHSIFVQNTFWHTSAHERGYNCSHIIGPVAHLHLSYMTIICSIHNIFNV